MFNPTLFFIGGQFEPYIILYRLGDSPNLFFIGGQFEPFLSAISNVNQMVTIFAAKNTARIL